MGNATAEPAQAQESEALADARYTVALHAADVNRVCLRITDGTAEDEKIQAVKEVATRAARTLSRARDGQPQVGENGDSDAWYLLDIATGFLWTIVGAASFAESRPDGDPERIRSMDSLKWVANELRHNPRFGGGVDLGSMDDV